MEDRKSSNPGCSEGDTRACAKLCTPTRKETARIIRAAARRTGAQLPGPPPQPTLVTRELEKAFADRDIQRRKNLPPVDPRGHTGVAAGATRAGAARDRRR